MFHTQVCTQGIITSYSNITVKLVHSFQFNMKFFLNLIRKQLLHFELLHSMILFCVYLLIW